MAGTSELGSRESSTGIFGLWKHHCTLLCLGVCTTGLTTTNVWFPLSLNRQRSHLVVWTCLGYQIYRRAPLFGHRCLLLPVPFSSPSWMWRAGNVCQLWPHHRLVQKPGPGICVAFDQVTHGCKHKVKIYTIIPSFGPSRLTNLIYPVIILPKSHSRS